MITNDAIKSWGWNKYESLHVTSRQIMKLHMYIWVLCAMGDVEIKYSDSDRRGNRRGK